MKPATVFFMACGLLAATALLALLTAFVPQTRVTEVRRPATHTVLKPGAQDMPTSIVSCGNGIRQWAVRGRVFTREALGPILVFSSPNGDEDRHVAPKLSVREQASMVALAPGGVRLFTGAQEVVFQDDAQGVFSPLLGMDDPGLLLLFSNQPRQYGDALDISGHPLRWGQGEYLFHRQQPGSPEQAMTALRRSVERRMQEQVLAGRQMRPALAFRQIVESCAERFGLNVALVYAIIHSESNFSTTLVSPKSAMGLMQILPGTASGEIHRYLHGQSGTVGFAQLREPEINIRYGTAYLHILLTRYFSAVHDPLSREYCAVAAYNMGPNRLLRFYGPDDVKAVARINAMSAQELFHDLVTRLPYRETRTYVGRVQQRKAMYAALGAVLS